MAICHPTRNKRCEQIQNSDNRMNSIQHVPPHHITRPPFLKRSRFTAQRAVHAPRSILGIAIRHSNCFEIYLQSSRRRTAMTAVVVPWPNQGHVAGAALYTNFDILCVYLSLFCGLHFVTLCISGSAHLLSPGIDSERAEQWKLGLDEISPPLEVQKHPVGCMEVASRQQSWRISGSHGCRRSGPLVFDANNTHPFCSQSPKNSTLVVYQQSDGTLSSRMWHLRLAASPDVSSPCV